MSDIISKVVIDNFFTATRVICKSVNCVFFKEGCSFKEVEIDKNGRCEYMVTMNRNEVNQTQEKRPMTFGQKA